MEGVGDSRDDSSESDKLARAQISKLCKISKQKRAKPGPPQPLPAASEMTPASSPSSRLDDSGQSHVECCSQGWGQRLNLPCRGVSWSPQLSAQSWDLLSNLVSPLPTEEITLLLLI